MSEIEPAPVRTRQRFRFSLRMLFIVVTVLGVWLGYELNWLRQRHEMIVRHQFRMKHWQGSPSEFADLEVKVAVLSNTPRSGPGLLWLFGERAVVSLGLLDSRKDGSGFDQARDAQAAKRLFPEAGIHTLIIDPKLK